MLADVLIVLMIGAVLKLWLDRARSAYRISRVEYVVGALICALIIVPATVTVGTHWARASKLRYLEFWNGFERRALRERTGCVRDGACVHDYDCDPYQYTYTVTVPDGDGKGSHTEVRTETRYHSCPYATEEWTYVVDTTLGDYVIARHWLDDDPTPFRGRGIPSSLPRGVPNAWVAAKARIDAGTPGGATLVKPYDNYILASQRTILRRYGGLVDTYLRDRLLPAPARDTYAGYHADKVYFVGPASYAERWQEYALRLNGALGAERQGDLHLVIVNDDRVRDPDEYLNALMAYWQGPRLGHHDVSKNAVVVVLGTDGRTVKWARAATGMPRGNEAMAIDVRDRLPGTPLDPDAVLGQPRATYDAEGKLSVTHTHGALESVLWGSHGFVRVSMSCRHKGDNCVGYRYLGGDIQPSPGQRRVMLLVVILLSIVVWGGLIAYGPSLYRDRIGGEWM